MDDLYRDYILEHYRRPHNFGVLDDPDASYEGSNPLCGDRITLMLGVKDGVVEFNGFSRSAGAGLEIFIFSSRFFHVSQPSFHTKQNIYHGR